MPTRYPEPEPEPEDDPGHVRIRRAGGLARVTLDRPKAINALTFRMVSTIRRALLRWETDHSVERVLIDGNGARGFCAGGDIRVLHHDALHRTGAARRLWREEYLLDALVANFRKPVVTLVDGVTMGGGIGLGCHAAWRVVTDRAVLAMPEVAIGIAPDVGGLLLLSRAPGLLGTHLALTGDRFGAADALHLGVADAIVPSTRLDDLRRLLVDHPAEVAIRAVAEATGPAADRPGGSEAPLARHRPWIDACYDSDDAPAVVENLAGRPEEEARAAAERIERVAPLAVCVTLRALHEVRRLNRLTDVLAQDYRVGCRFLYGSDIVQGINAAVIDKKALPRWSPERIADVAPHMVARHFDPLGADELDVAELMRIA